MPPYSTSASRTMPPRSEMTRVLWQLFVASRSYMPNLRNKPAINARQTTTKIPPLSSVNRCCAMLHLLSNVANACNKLFYDGVRRRLNLFRRTDHMNASLVQHCDAIRNLVRAHHVMQIGRASCR